MWFAPFGTFFNELFALFEAFFDELFAPFGTFFNALFAPFDGFFVKANRVFLILLQLKSKKERKKRG